MLLSLQNFAAAAREGFDLGVGEASMPLTLVEAKPMAVQPFPGMLREPFALVFRAASQVVLPQKLYRVSNPTIGALDIFLVPVGQDGQGTLYQAVFS
ncbi:MAG: hypothetical protein U0S50_13535 [Sphingopyxis sp.]|uniref:DUF6916 family protein n=1 Tax=Sphingopyxis sp. TaxID=1908224 RepID=UPI002AB98BA3|nr:hypothetical protein [Sphingopyxis sp.]MDZ3832817.1 hypothetical protein [Sphingopyxis sp.]